MLESEPLVFLRENLWRDSGKMSLLEVNRRYPSGQQETGDQPESGDRRKQVRHPCQSIADSRPRATFLEHRQYSQIRRPLRVQTVSLIAAGRWRGIRFLSRFDPARSTPL